MKPSFHFQLFTEIIWFHLTRIEYLTFRLKLTLFPGQTMVPAMVKEPEEEACAEEEWVAEEACAAVAWAEAAVCAVAEWEVAAVCAVAEWVAEETAIREILICQEQQRQLYN